MPRRWAAASALTGTALVIVALTNGVGGRTVATEGSVPPPATPSVPVAPADPPPMSEVAPPPPPTPRTLTPPESVRIDALDATAAVVPVALTPDGAMELPEDVREVGWFSPGPVPGQAGSAVLAGHVDSRTQGRGVLFDLPALEPGNDVEVTAADGTTTAWRVVGRTAYDKDALPIADLFRRDGPARLVLITCGGAFDPATGHYEDNVVVIAEPA